MASARVKEYTAEQCLYYIALTDYPSYAAPRSVTDASRYLGMSGHSTISSAVNQRFLPEKILKKVRTPTLNTRISSKPGSTRQSYLFSPGANAKFIEKEIDRYVSAFNSAKFTETENFEAPVSEAVSVEPVDVTVIQKLRWCAGERISLPHLNKYRYHINGSGFVFDVLQEGRIQSLTIPYKDGWIEESLFGSSPPTLPKGCVQFDETYIVPGVGGFGLRYQHYTSSNIRILTIHPPMIVSPYIEGWTEKEIIEDFLKLVYPLLDRLERFGGWKFRRVESGAYAFHIPKGQDGDGTSPGNGVRLEIGFDELATALVREKLGEFGTPGVTPSWYDKSLHALGKGELETKHIDIVAAWDCLPETTRLARENRLIQMEQQSRLNEQDAEIKHLTLANGETESRLDKIDARLDRVYGILEKVADNEESAANRLDSQYELISRITDNVTRTSEAMRIVRGRDGKPLGRDFKRRKRRRKS